ncbi:hypothetical protein PSET11_03326 [Arthrobacter ulcerisalmonis]|uniref:Uncharacterized protein n=1 Tax=Arthrobacter ulcerisalmonis TaxID=2483813 RepID=A0A3P5XW42_9MICC|nr:hypothetical protein [Arthrobacter ulcerisalmonis]VDC33346.1 hypothetical protein PSET11_03326 [Arthrobacter ulcerisalmonis]
MNREERRRQEKANRQTGRIQKSIPPERLGAEIQDFMAGTIFVHGASGLRPDADGPDLPPLYMVVLDKASLSPAPELLRLFALLESEGTVKLNAQLQGTARWGAMPGHDGQMLAKLELDLAKPVKTRPSFLLLADNYKDIWDIPATQGYVLGITTTERFAALGDSTSYADALEACIVMLPDPSNAAQMLHDNYTAGGQPFATAPHPTVIFNGDEADDMRYQVGIATGRDGELLYPFMLLRPTGITQIPMGEGSVPKAISSGYAERGMHWFTADGASIKRAEGWSWKERGPEFIITDADGILIASFEPETTDEEGQWLETVRSTGGLVLNIGDELVMDDGISTREQMIAAHKRGNVVTGLILHASAPAVSDVNDPAPAPHPTEVSPEADTRPWWKRLFRP